MTILLLDAGADREARAQSGRTALDWAIKNDQPQIVELMEMPDLLRTAKYGNAVHAEQLLAHGADVNEVDADHCSALYWAAKFGHADVASLLIGAGAHIERASVAGGTPLMAAAASGSVEVVEVLLAAGANRERQSKSGRTALDWAKENKQQQVVVVMEATQPSAAAAPNAPNAAATCASKTRSLDSSPVSVVSTYTF